MKTKVVPFVVVLLTIAASFIFTTTTGAQSNLNLRVMAANTTSANNQSYEPEGIRIFQGLQPDIVAIQEFQYGGSSVSNDLRTLVNTAFGSEFSFYCEPGYNIPNGIVSRYPIIAAGSWDDSLAPDRGFAWAQIDLPGTNDLYVVSVHLLTANASTRASEALQLKGLIQSNFPAEAWIIIGGDCNTDARSEACINTFKTFLSDSPIPTDAVTGGNENTSTTLNTSRSKPYDYVLPSFSLTNYLTSVVLPSHTFPKGLVFDSTVYSPLSDVSPVQFGDSEAPNMQHMAVIKDFLIPVDGNTTNPPSTSVHPVSQTVTVGGNATFNVVASGSAPLIYQWRFAGTNIGGAMLDSYTRSNAQLVDAGNYTVVVTNSFGSVTSAVAVLTVNPPVTGNVLAQWNFNSTSPDTNTSTGTTTPSIGTGTASLVTALTQAFVGGSTNDPASAGTDNSGWNTTTYPAAAVGNKTAGVRFDVSTLGKQNLTVRWDQRVSNTGSKYSRLQYTTNGSTFIDFPSAVTVASPTNFEPRTNNLSGLPGVNNNASFGFRIVNEFEFTATGSGASAYAGASSPYATTGTTRFDMVTLLGEAITVSNPPAITPTITNAALVGAQFQFQLTGTTGSNYVVQATPNLSPATWISLRTNAAPFTFVESNVFALPQRFYRGMIAP